jgi:6-phosphogluconate dehydrogenase
MKPSVEKPSIGVIGLRVMGSNLARNIESRGYSVAVYNRNQDVLNEFTTSFADKKFVASPDIAAFVASMQSPRQIFLMIEAGKPVDVVLEQLMPHLQEGDIVIDGGNSFFEDTNRRENECAQKKIRFVGVGISGGEEGALKGPSIMPGGPKEAWDILSPLLEKIAAQVEGPCTDYIGPQGAGHYVKMVHNGIEYADMQLIAEAYHLLKAGLGVPSSELAPVFAEWNEGPLSSFLIEISAKCLAKKDDQGDGYLVDKILDSAGQKGTGRWTAMEAIKLGVAVPSLVAAVDARVLSSMKQARIHAESIFGRPSVEKAGDRVRFTEMVRGALYCSKIMAYAQGMDLLATASREYKWGLRLDSLARIWKGGCIIRARFLDEIKKAFKDNPELPNLILHTAMQNEVQKHLSDLRQTVAYAAQNGIPIPAFGSSLAYFDSYTSASLPQNLTQAQRDCFGAHTFKRLDKEGSFHADWS